MRTVRMGLLVGALALGVGCGGRAVNVTTGASTASDASIAFTNNLTQAVNVYVYTGTSSAGGELFLRQVAGGATETLQVRGIAAGASVNFKATTIDGLRTYTKENVVLARGIVWQVP
jgi:hypothetical protein